MNLLKNKLFLATPILAFVVIFIFSLSLFPSVQPQPRSLPIAIVNEDKGIQSEGQATINAGEQIVEQIKTAMDDSTQTNEEPAVKWIEVSTMEDVQHGLDDRKYYAALIIPKDFSVKQASLRTSTPSSPEVEILVNQGMNMAASTAAGQILNGVVDNMNTLVRTQILEGLSRQNATLTAGQAAGLVTPISKKVTNVNEVGTNSGNGNAPISLFQPLWMACLVSAALMTMALKKMSNPTRKFVIVAKLIQILTGAVIAVIVGFGLTWLADSMVGLNIAHFADTAWFLSLTTFSFFLMILAVLAVIGLPGMSIFALLLFFGAPLLALAPEMMPPFYQDWVYPWLPMRFMIEGLRDIFFFGKGLYWSPFVSTLFWIAATGAVVILTATLKTKRTSS